MFNIVTKSQFFRESYIFYGVQLSNIFYLVLFFCFNRLNKNERGQEI